MQAMLFFTGLVIAAIGATTGAISVGAELTSHEPIYKVIMKASSICFGIGGLIMGLSSIV